MRQYSNIFFHKIKQTLFIAITLCATVFFAPPTITHAGVIPYPINNLGLVGYWSFEDTQDDDVIKDYTGFNNNGTPSGFNETDNHIAGYKSTSSAIDLNGSSEYLNIPDSNSWDFGTEDFTISFWVKYDSFYPALTPLIAHGEGIVGDLPLYSNWAIYNTSTHIYLDRYDGTQYPISTAWTAQTDQWYLITVNRIADDILFYIDGNLIGTGTGAGSISYSIGTSLPILIGYARAGNGGTTHRRLDGQIDDVRIYNRALSAREISLLYKTGARIKQIAKTSNLVGYWSFEENSGTQAQDYSGNGNTGTLTNMENSDWVNGRVGKALDFDGSDEYATIGDASTFKFLHGANDTSSFKWTIGFWIKRDNFSAGVIPIGTGQAGSSQVETTLYLETDGRLFIAIGRGVNGQPVIGGYTSGSYYPIDTAWHHVLVSYDQALASANAKFYVDGVFVESLNKTGNTPSTADASNPLRIGSGVNAGATSAPVDGQIDEVRIYNTALSATEIQNIYSSSKYTKINSSQNSKITDGLVGMWSFNGADVNNTTAFDRSGNGNDGTKNGGVVPAQGKVGQAFSFDGVDDYVSLSNTDTFSSGARTYTGWFKSGASADQAIIDGGNTGSPQKRLGIRITPTGELICYVRWNDDSPPQAYRYSLDAVNDSQWHHFACEINIDTSTISIYIDGLISQGGQTGTSFGSLLSSSSVNIGVSYDASTYYFNGLIDELRIYNRALTTAEITRLYRLGR